MKAKSWLRLASVLLGAVFLLGAMGVADAATKTGGNMKKIYVLATGGTIAGSAADETATTGYRAGAIGVGELIAAVPELKRVADVTGEQISSIDSKDMTEDIQLRLARRCNELLAFGDYDGVVITHGTDTLEETAYLLSLLTCTEKPIVLTGSMRPATAISADGPLNLLDAVRVAASDLARDKGVLVVANNQIDGAYDVTKTHTTAVQTFASPNYGALGCVDDGVVRFYRQPVKTHLPNSLQLSQNIKSLPRVDILYAHASDDGALVDAVIAAGAKGIIYAGMGNGSIPEPVVAKFAAAREKGVAIVRSTRSARGTVTQAEQEYEDLGILQSGTLNPQKARLLLQLGLAQGMDNAALRELFANY